MTPEYELEVRLIPIKHINILNPRARGKKKFAQIAENIFKLGLKRPVSVAPAGSQNGEPRYDLICGQGRIESYVLRGEEEIPALVIRASKEDLLLMSLAENLARRQHSAVELVREISTLKDRGYSDKAIASKIDVSIEYVRGIAKLLAKGEDKLLQAVEKGQIPVNIAVTIATSDDKGIQRALTDAYEKHALRGKPFMQARRLVESRRVHGKGVRGRKRSTTRTKISADDLVRTYQKETMRQKLTIQRRPHV